MKFVIVWRSLLTNTTGRGTMSFEHNEELENFVETLNHRYSGIITHWLESTLIG